ncbi:MAG: branched-chain amino acid transport system permease protein, partial [Subtercola sp.]|nr:branched-chain amino acid transport system permease protein [Subtercola sp.]
MAARMIEWLAANAPLLRNISVLALLGYSVQLALRAGVFSFATVGFYAIGGYATANLLKMGWNWGLVLPLVLVAGFVVALVISPVLNRLRHLYLAMATLAFTLFIQSLALSWATFTGGAQGMFGVRRVLPQGVMIAIVLIVVLVVWFTQR